MLECGPPRGNPEPTLQWKKVSYAQTKSKKEKKNCKKIDCKNVVQFQDGILLDFDETRGGNAIQLNSNPVARMRIVDAGNLLINDVRPVDEGRYQCIASNMVGTRESASAKLTVQGSYIFMFMAFNSSKIWFCNSLNRLTINWILRSFYLASMIRIILGQN